MPRRRCFALLLAAALSAPARLAAQGAAGFDLSSLQIPDGMFELRDVAMFSGSRGGANVVATTTVMGSPANVLLSTAPGTGGARRFIFALQPSDFSLSRAFPALANPVLDDLPLSHVGLVITNDSLTIPSAALNDDEWAFYREIYHADEFTLRLTPGINLIAAIPAESLPQGSPLIGVMDALGIEKGTILLQGTLGKSLTMLTGGVSAAALRDLMLRAELPPMRPPGSPEWFHAGQLALEITGEPSVRLVGAIDVAIDSTELQFFLAAMLARSGVSLAGGMRAPEPWVAPFGVSWLTMKSVVLQIGLTPTGVLLGFGGAAVIGEKDIDVAMSVVLSPPLGTPSAFAMRGASDSGVALTDLAKVQQGMAMARDAAAGNAVGTAQPLIPLDALPDVAIRTLALAFATQPNPELGIERGFKIRGRLWLPTGPGGELADFAGVDAGVTDEGLWVRGDISAFQLGPLSFDQAEIDLAATRAEQHLILRGQVQIGLSRQMIDLYLGRDALRFRSETELFGLFHATLTCQSSFNLRNPSFMVDAVVQNDFGEYVQPILREGILRFAVVGRGVLNGAQAALTIARDALALQQATVNQLRAALTAMRASAEAAWRTADRAADAALASANAAKRERDAARRLWDNTPDYQVALRATRYAEYLRLGVVYAARTTAYAVQRTAADARRAILDAIPTVDRNVLLLAANEALAELRRRLEQAERDVAALAAKYDAIIEAIEAGADPFSIQYAAFRANLSAMSGGGMAWTVRGVFVGRPFELHRELDFGSPVQAVAGLLSGLVGS